MQVYMFCFCTFINRVGISDCIISTSFSFSSLVVEGCASSIEVIE
jgi:hypothetical protein